MSKSYRDVTEGAKLCLPLEFLRNIFKRTTRPSRWIIVFAVLALVWVTVYIGMVFYQVNSTISDYSWGDASFYNQLAYNFIHGRPLQTSLYRNCSPAVWGNNPFPYLHSFNIHVNFTPYLMLWLYKFMPTVNGLYFITIFFNIVGFLGIGWLIVRQISSDRDRLIAYALACAAFFAALPFVYTVTYKGHYALFAGPLILAAYYYCLRGNRFMLAVMGLLLCGITEDMAMFMCTFSAYLFIFEKRVRKVALWMCIGSAAYMAIAFFVIQPACEVGFPIAYANDLLARFGVAHPQGFFNWPGVFRVTAYLALLGAALALMALFSNFNKAINWKKPLGLIFVAPASHWFIFMTEGGGHHIIPILACTFLALLLIATKLEFRPIAVMRIAAFVLIGTAVFLPKAYRMTQRFPFRTDAKLIARMETNKSTLREVAALPEKASVSYWTNQGIDAFLTSRNDVWRFPDYFDSADYLVIQKDADQTFYRVKEDSSGGMETAIKEGQFYTSNTEIPMSAEAVKRIENELVDVKASHEVKVENKHVLILKRKKGMVLPRMEYTIGLNWVKNIGKKNIVIYKNKPGLEGK